MILLALSTGTTGGKPDITPEAASTLKRVRQTGVLIAGVSRETPPFSMPGPAGEPTGFDVDLVRGLADRLGVRLRLIPLKGGARIAAVNSGRVHLVAASLTRTSRRDALVDFSLDYFLDNQRILVRSDSGIDGVEDLEGRRVGVTRDSTAEQTLRSRAPGAVPVLFSSSREGLPALLAGRIEAILSDGAILAGLRRLIASPERLAIVGEPLSNEPYAIALPENDPHWRREVNSYLVDLWESGRWRQLAEKWLPDAPPGTREFRIGGSETAEP
jgi:polar amino acid transport system substrate-binding protein